MTAANVRSTVQQENNRCGKSAAELLQELLLLQPIAVEIPALWGVVSLPLRKRPLPSPLSLWFLLRFRQLDSFLIAQRAVVWDGDL